MAQAIHQLRKCLSILRDLGEAYLVQTADPLIALGRMSASEGKLQEASRFLGEALEVLNSQEYTYGLATCLETICALSGVSPDIAATLLGKAKAIREKEAFGIPISGCRLVDPLIENLQSKLGKESLDSAAAEGIGLSYEKAIEMAFEALKSVM